MADNFDGSPTPPEAGPFDEMIARARAGDRAALPGLRAHLDANPEVWRHAGDLAAHAMELWIGLIAGPDLAASESLARKAAELEAELAGPAPSPLERLLAGRVVACWLQVHYCDASVARSVDVSLRQAALALRRQDMAHRRYLQAIGAPATVRRLVPAAAGPGGFGSPPGLEAAAGVEVGGGDPGRAGPLVVFDAAADGPGAGREAARSAREPVALAC